MQEKSEDQLPELPAEMLESIMTFLDPRDLGRLELVSKDWRTLASGDPVWKKAIGETKEEFLGTIHYVSLDFDGCLFNKQYVAMKNYTYTKHTTRAVLDANKQFLDELNEQNLKLFPKTYAFIGSHRQDYETDLSNAGGYNNFKGSCCSAMNTICDELGITLDPFMLADVEGRLESGTSFQRIIEEIQNNSWIDYDMNINQHVTCSNFDQSKRVLLFAQMQRAAAKHPGKQIIFDFFDDNERVHSALIRYFNEYPHMIPKNLSLRIYSYAGNEVRFLQEFSGTGNLILDYYAYIDKMNKNIHLIEEYSEELKEVALQETLEEKKQFVICKMTKEGLFVENIEDLESLFIQNPDAPFAVRPSRQKIEGFNLFAASYQIPRGIASLRFALDIDDKLFLFDEENVPFEVEMHSEGLIATLSDYIKGVQNQRGEILYNELKKSPYFVEDPAKAIAVLEQNPQFPFVIRKSGASWEGMSTFTAVYNTSEGITFTRYGLNQEGILFTLDDEKEYELGSVSTDILGFLKRSIDETKKGIESGKKIESTPAPSEQEEKPERKENDLARWGVFSVKERCPVDGEQPNRPNCNM